jgi:two-component system sensor histidine kinase/response regulator
MQSGQIPIAEAKGLELVREVDPGLPAWLKGDPLRLRQILGNFLRNAVKSAERGRITLRFHQIAASGRKATVRFEVEDQGIGVSPEMQARVFQWFE